MTALIFAICVFISAILGGLLGIKNQNRLHYIISFTAGILIAVVFFDIIPEILEVVSEKNISITVPMMAVMIGFLAIHILEKYALIHHSHEEKYANHKHPAVGLVGALGLTFHSFLDGIAIGVGFQAGYKIGLLISIAVLAHSFADGLNAVSLMLINNNSKKKTKLLLLFVALAPILGVLVTSLFAIPENILVVYLGFFAGFILYIGAADLLPEAHSKNSSLKLVGLTILGMLFVFIVTRLV